MTGHTLPISGAVYEFHSSPEALAQRELIA